LRHALILSTALIAACAAGGAAMAQQAQPTTTSDGLRYLSWSGKAPAPRPSAPRPAAPSPAPRRVAATPTAPIPLARLEAPAPTVRATSPRRGLTPASDWLSPAPTPTPAPLPTQVAATEPAPVAASPAPAPAPAPASAAPHPTENAPAEPAFDPMAPRRDAPIFRLRQQAAAEPTHTQDVQTPAASNAPAAAQPQMVQAALAPAPVLGARFYSVHRQAGRQPDPIQAVQPLYLDALPVEMTQTPSSTDLAQPDAPPALLRNSDGTVRAMPQTEADDLP
jgi:hypothetical protein